MNQQKQFVAVVAVLQLFFSVSYTQKYSLYLYLYKYKILVWTFHIPNFELTNEARAEDKLACTMPCKEEVDEVNCNTATLQRFF